MDPGRPQGANGSLETLPEPGIPESGTFLTESLRLEVAGPLGWSLSTKGSGLACPPPYTPAVHTCSTHLQRQAAHFHLGSSLLYSEALCYRLTSAHPPAHSPVLLWGELRGRPSPICTWTQLPRGGPRGGGSGSWGPDCFRSSVSVLWEKSGEKQSSQPPASP